MNKLFARLSEPSTHAGIALGLQVAAGVLPSYAGLFNWLSAGFASLAVAVPEKAAA